MFIIIYMMFCFIISVILLMGCSEKSKSPQLMNDTELNIILEKELYGTVGPIYSLDWSPTGNMLVSSGYSQINLWDLDSLKHIEKISHHDSYVWSVSWSPEKDDMNIASGSQDGTLKIWSEERKEVIEILHRGWIFCSSWSSDGSKIAFGNSEGMIEIFDISLDSTIFTYQLERPGNFPSRAIICISWSPNEDIIAAGCWYGGILIIDTSARSVREVLDARSNERYDVNGLCFSPDGQLLMSAYQDGYIRIWNIRDGSISKKIKAHNGWVRGIDCSPDGEMVASGGADNAVYVWNVKTSKRYKFPIDSPQPIWSISWSPDGRQLAAGNGIYNSQYADAIIYVCEIVR